MSAVSVSNEREIDPFSLSLEQLQAMKVQHEDEVAELTRQLEALYGARGRFYSARSAVEDLVKPENGEWDDIGIIVEIIIVIVVIIIVVIIIIIIIIITIIIAVFVSIII